MSALLTKEQQEERFRAVMHDVRLSNIFRLEIGFFFWLFGWWRCYFQFAPCLWRIEADGGTNGNNWTGWLHLGPFTVLVNRHNGRGGQ